MRGRDSQVCHCGYMRRDHINSLCPYGSLANGGHFPGWMGTDEFLLSEGFTELPLLRRKPVVKQKRGL